MSQFQKNWICNQAFHFSPTVVYKMIRAHYPSLNPEEKKVQESHNCLFLRSRRFVLSLLKRLLILLKFAKPAVALLTTDANFQEHLKVKESCSQAFALFNRIS